MQKVGGGRGQRVGDGEKVVSCEAEVQEITGVKSRREEKHDSARQARLGSHEQ